MPKAKWKNFTDDELKQIVAESTSFVEIQKKMGYSGKSGTTTETLKKYLNKKILIIHILKVMPGLRKYQNMKVL